MWEREAATAFHNSDKLFLQYDRTVQQNNLLIEVYVILKLKSEFLGFTMFLLVKLLYTCKAVGRLEKSACKRHSQIELGRGQGFFWRLYVTTATASLKAKPVFPYVATENTKVAATMMKQSRMIHCVQETAGPAGCTLLLHSAASHVTRVLVHNPTSTLGQMRGEGIHGEAAVSLLHGALHLFQICISNSTPLSLPNFSLLWYFPSLETSPSFFISMKHSLERVKFLLFNVVLLDKHLGTASCLAEVLFSLDTGQ